MMFYGDSGIRESIIVSDKLTNAIENITKDLYELNGYYPTYDVYLNINDKLVISPTNCTRGHAEYCLTARTYDDVDIQEAHSLYSDYLVSILNGDDVIIKEQIDNKPKYNSKLNVFKRK